MPFKPSPLAAVVFAVLFVGSVLIALVAAGASLFMAVSESPAEAAVHRIEGVDPAARIQAVHAESGAPDGPACVLTDTEVLRVEGGRVTRRVPARGARVEVVERPLSVVVTGEDGTELTCTFGLGEGVDVFAGMIRATIRQARPADWRPPVDPRVRHLYEGE